MRRHQAFATAVLVLAAWGPLLADGLIVPTRPEVSVRGQWSVKHHSVDIRVRDQVASVSIDQAFVNNGKNVLEVEYMFPVPPDAAIRNMTLVVDGKEFTAKLLKADEARKIYEEIVRKKKDPALLEYAGYGMYKTSAFPLQPGKPCKVVINYSQICPKDGDVVDVWYPLNTEKFSAKPLEEVKVTVDIRSKADVGPVYSPTHDLTVRRDKDDTRHVTAEYKASNTLPRIDFQLYYTASSEQIGASFLAHQPDPQRDGYFMLLASPNPRHAKVRAVAKDIVLTLDTSGSMGGEKIRQAKEAAAHVLKNLNDGDRFNVVAFSDGAEPFFKTLQPVNGESLKEAMDRLDRLEASGGTAIHDALMTSLGMFSDKGAKRRRSARPVYVLFMTDGLPTIGEGNKTEEKVIVADTGKANSMDARIFTFGVGYNVNTRLLDRITLDNGGRSAYVKEKEPIESKISSLYRKIRNPVMTDVTVEVSGLRLTNTYPREVGDLFEGDQITLVGRYDAGDAKKLRGAATGPARAQLTVKGNYLGKPKGFEYEVNVVPPGRDFRYEFVEQLWATRRVGFLLEQMHHNGEEQELVDEVIRLSREYGIMTPYTSFLADEESQVASGEKLRGRWMKENSADMESHTGVGGVRNSTNRTMLAEAKRPAVNAQADKGGADGTPGKLGYSADGGFTGGKTEVVGTVRQVGKNTLYRRGKQWLANDASRLDDEKLKEAIEVERFSKEYFELVRANDVAENQVFASQRSSEELVVKLRGTVYRIK
ncbi:MAG: VIT domain-containing protein [Phycisphaerae bacterium]